MAKLVAFVDGSIYSESVLDHAAWAARQMAAEVDVVHVIGRRSTTAVPVSLSGNLEFDASHRLLEELAEHDRQNAKLSQQRGRLIVDGGAERLRRSGVDEVHARLRSGDMLEAVQELEPGTDLVIIGKRGEAADFAKLHLGSNLERVVRVCSKPVLVANRKFRPIRRFLVAFDGGASVMKAIDHIAGGTLFAGLPCQLVMAGRETAEVRARIETAAAKLRTAGYEVAVHFEEGPPEEVIARRAAAEEIDLLVMGAYGHSRVRNLIIGSTTTAMIRSVLIPVMLFR